MTVHTVNRSSFTDELILDGTVQAVRSSTLVCPQQIDGTVIFLVEDGTPVKKGDTVCIIENREYTNYYETLLDKVEQSKAQYKKGQADLELNDALLQAQVKSNEAQTRILFLDSAQLEFLTEQQRKIKELQLQIATIEKQKIENKLRFMEQINESELKKLALRIRQDENQAANVKEIIDKMVLTAPLDGLALRAISRRTGDKIQETEEVWEGMPLIEIPDRSEVNVIIMASETQYRRIRENDPVLFTFDAKPGNTGWGKIAKKASTGQPIRRNSSIRQFEITASVDSFTSLPEIGVSARCRVFMTQIPDTLVIPQLAVFEEDSMKFVYIVRNKRFDRQQILLGNSSPRNAVVIGGLEGGETVSFVKPRASKIRTTLLLPDSLVKKSTPPVPEPNPDVPQGTETFQQREEFRELPSNLQNPFPI